MKKRLGRRTTTTGIVAVLVALGVSTGCGSSDPDAAGAPTSSAAAGSSLATQFVSARYLDDSLPTRPGSEPSFPDEFATIDGITAASNAVVIGRIVAQQRNVLTHTSDDVESNPDGSTEVTEWDGVVVEVSQVLKGSVDSEVVIPAFPVTSTDDGTVAKVEDPLAEYLAKELVSSPDQSYLMFLVEIDGGYRFTSFGAVAPVDTATNFVGVGLFSGPFAEASDVDRHLDAVTERITAAAG